MSKVELVYFDGCPNVEKARSAIQQSGLPFSEVRQNALCEDSAYRAYSSPTILVDGEVAVGSRNCASACSIIRWDEAAERILALSKR